MKKVVLASVIYSVLATPAAMAAHYDGFTNDNRGWDDIKTGYESSYDGPENTYHIFTQDELLSQSAEIQTRRLATGVSMAQTKTKTNEVAIKTESEQRKAENAQLSTRINSNANTISTNTGDISNNKSEITDNKAGIDNNANTISTNTGDISNNKNEIADNKAGIDKLQAAATSFESIITESRDNVVKTKAQIDELYATSNAYNSQVAENSQRITDNAKRINKIEFQVQDLYQEVKRLDGAIAASTAVGSMVTPKYKGDTVISVGMGHYNDASALAIGATHNLSDNVAIRATIAGSDADNWAKPIMGASANWAF